MRLLSAMVVLFGCLQFVIAEDDGEQGELTSKPQWQRLLTGDDAKKAEELKKQIEELEEKDDYPEGIKTAEELLALRTKLQGADHHETITAQYAVLTLRTVARMDAGERRNWRLTTRKWREAQKLRTKARYVEAFSIEAEILEIRRKVLGEEHPDTAESYTNVAYNLAAQGKEREAHPLYQKAFEIYLKVFGEEHPDTANSYNNVAGILNAQARYVDAQPLFEKSLEIYRKVLGDEHPKTATSYYNVAANLIEQAKYAEAQPLLQKALKIQRKVLGEEHPDTRISYNQLALNLTAQGKAPEAHPLLQKSLEICRKTLGEEHPDTARGYDGLGMNLNAQAKYAEAQPLLKKSLEIRTRVLGEEHADTATSYNNVAYNLDAQAKFAEAEPLHRKALEIRRKVLGEEHSDTAKSYNNVAANLDAQSKYAEAQPLFEKSLEIWRKVLGEEHPYTAISYINVASNLRKQAKYGEARPLCQKALEICRKVLGEEHPYTASCYSALAINLHDQAKDVEAQPLFQKAMEIRRKVLGEEHPDMAKSYNDVAGNLNAQAKYVEAQPFFQKALEIRRKFLGEEHPDTASSYNNVASNLNAQAKYADAQPFLQKALEISRKALGEDHPDTARYYNNLANNLNAQALYLEAQPLLQKAMEIRRKVFGEEHPDMASSYNNVANNLNDQAKYADAQPFLQKALEISRKALGEDHPDTARHYNNLASNLNAQGEVERAQPLYQKALEIWRKVLGEEHPDTATSYSNLAANLLTQGKYAEAVHVLRGGIGAFEASRLARAQGVERAIGEEVNPRLLLAAIEQKTAPASAWENVEGALSRGLLDQQAQVGSALTRAEAADVSQLQSRLAEFQAQILPLLTKSMRTAEEDARVGQLLKERQEAGARLAALAVADSERLVASTADIQAALPAQGAHLFWVDVSSKPELQEHWACLVHHTGEPHWERLPGTGEDKKWTDEDSQLPRRLRNALSGSESASEIDGLSRLLRSQRLDPLAQQLSGVTTLYVVGVNEMAGVPVEVLAPEYTISYVPSGTFLARAREKAPAAGSQLLALGDPVFAQQDEEAAPSGEAAPPSEDLPPGGLLVLQMVPDGNAAKARLQAGDVLVRYADVELTSVEDLTAAIQSHSEAETNSLVVWREGATELLTRDVPPGKLGVVLSKEPAREVIANRRKTDQMLLALRGGDWNELPGTRVEVSQIAGLFGDQAATLLDSAASEESLNELRRNGELAKFGYLHFATHGETNNVKAFESALILAQDGLPETPLPRAGEPFLNGQLSAREVLDFWKLDAELVTLSACESGLGRRGGGDGLLGFAQAFLTAGARSVCLSLWKVDDAATALLMTRFYQNLLGKRAGLEKAMPKAEALAEAKVWLRNLTVDEVTNLTADLTNGVARGAGRKALPLLPPVAEPKEGDIHPYAHPHYWAAFVLIGDPE